LLVGDPARELHRTTPTRAGEFEFEY